ncbi:hypothetical protein [Archangium sp.]|uniref:hypothetical protein n=1 Tax=Archangium sp. TaxID=1872627 RepID=UPI002D2344D6|nr:hypothetical protein [Archangium sp.]HYO58067.1 hypothetical protein [Archangium sp.]
MPRAGLLHGGSGGPGARQPTLAGKTRPIITGLEAPAVIEALGHYLFEAGIAHSVRTNLAIARDLFEVNVAFANAFHEEAVRLLGADNNIDEKRRTTLRDPWIAEGIGHLLLLLSRKSPPLAPPGPLQVLTQIHADVHSHGLDLVWRVRRVFFPILGYAQAAGFEPTNDRPTFAALSCGADRIRLFSMPLVNHKEFFDQVADRIRFEATPAPGSFSNACPRCTSSLPPTLAECFRPHFSTFRGC